MIYLVTEKIEKKIKLSPLLGIVMARIESFYLLEFSTSMRRYKISSLQTHLSHAVNHVRSFSCYSLSQNQSSTHYSYASLTIR